jgi:hypothetical protein
MSVVSEKTCSDVPVGLVIVYTRSETTVELGILCCLVPIINT